MPVCASVVAGRHPMVSVATARPTRTDYYRVLADNLPPQALVVTSLGNASYLWAKLHDAPENFYFEDAMGLERNAQIVHHPLVIVPGPVRTVLDAERGQCLSKPDRCAASLCRWALPQFGRYRPRQSVGRQHLSICRLEQL